MRLILASKSPRRKEILTRLGYSFDILSENTDETMDPNLSVYDNVVNTAYTKARAVFDKFSDACIIGCDTIVVYNNKIYGKPKDEEDAYNTLMLLNNNTHSVISGVAIITKEKEYRFYVESFVTFKNNTSDAIKEYVSTGEPMDKAGSYAIQGLGKSLIDSYKGSLDNIIGLPSAEVKKVLDEVLK